ncbi:pseudouridine synthase, partial [Candidatus Kapabacteria bacterium]|nr:pseudouridine synthase [Candidatus Kapabacteria bacterium]
DCIMIRKRKFQPKPKFRENEPVVQKGPIRLNKYIADAGVCSRRLADELIARGKVKIDDIVTKELGTRVEPGQMVTVKGNPVSYFRHKVYVLLNKPKDIITTTSDDRGRKTVMHIVKRRERLFPVGRLDRNTTGALIMTNDGDLAHRLMHPSYNVEKRYKVTLNKQVDFQDVQRIASGVPLEDGLTSPSYIFVEPEDHTIVHMIMTEGRYREIRRMWEYFGYKVKKLDRKTFGNITTQALNRGQYRFMTPEEVKGLKDLVGMPT